MAFASDRAAVSALEMLAKPFRGPSLALATLLSLFAGASYCMGYAILSGNSNDWLHALGWSFGAVIPWLVVFEFLKRLEMGRSDQLSWPRVVTLMGLAGIASLMLEAVIDNFVWNDASAPLGLAILRRLPAIAVVMVLIAAIRRVDREVVDASEPLKAFAPHLVYVRAADNYLELHFADRMTMRRQTLASAERELTSLGFVRIHRSILAHPRHFALANIGGRPHAVGGNGRALPFGSRYKENIRHFVP